MNFLTTRTIHVTSCVVRSWAVWRDGLCDELRATNSRVTSSHTPSWLATPHHSCDSEAGLTTTPTRKHKLRNKENLNWNPVSLSNERSEFVFVNSKPRIIELIENRNDLTWPRCPRYVSSHQKDELWSFQSKELQNSPGKKSYNSPYKQHGSSTEHILLRTAKLYKSQHFKLSIVFSNVKAPHRLELYCLSKVLVSQSQQMALLAQQRFFAGLVDRSSIFGT